MLEGQEDFKLHLVIGEDIPDNVPDEFHMVALYVRDKDCAICTGQR